MFNYLETKQAYKHVVTPGGYLHVSWLLPDDKVVSFEYVPESYPAGSLCMWSSKHQYDHAISDVDWINEEEWQIERG